MVHEMIPPLQGQDMATRKIVYRGQGSHANKMAGRPRRQRHVRQMQKGRFAWVSQIDFPVPIHGSWLLIGRQL
nr:unnamed protein product [Digitaria exilis]